MDQGKTKPGDILFFAPASLTNDFENFSQLAAYVQSVPYGTSKPWHHVAVRGADEGNPVVGFAQIEASDGSAAIWTPHVVAEQWDATEGFDLKVLRPPGGGAAIAAAAAEMVERHVEYAIPGLLAFAAAMQARMFLEGSGRQRLLDFAAGAEAEGRKTSPRAETCVTSALQSIRAAGHLPDLCEPEPPRSYPQAQRPELRESILELFNRVQAGETVPVVGDGDANLLTDGDIQGGWGGDDAQGVVMVPGLIRTTAEYIRVLSGAILGYFPDCTAEQLISRGQLQRNGGGNPDGWQTSPAMLHDALERAGWSVVG